MLLKIFLKVGFHDQFVDFDMETIEHLVMDDLVDVGGDLYVAEHLVMDDPVAVGGELCIAEHLIVRNEIAGLACIDGDLHVGADVDERLLLKHYVQFVPGSKYVDWVIQILVVDL